jgi:hypothetical protein
MRCEWLRENCGRPPAPLASIHFNGNRGQEGLALPLRVLLRAGWREAPHGPGVCRMVMPVPQLGEEPGSNRQVESG